MVSKNEGKGGPQRSPGIDLPRIEHPTFQVTVPSTGQVEEFRPMLVREEKILLMAKESGDDGDVLRAVKRVIDNCAVRRGFSCNELRIFDVEYLFLKIRAASVDSTVTMSYRDNADGKVRDFTVDLNAIEVEFPEDADPNIQLTPSSGIRMQWAPATIYGDPNFIKAAEKDYASEIVLNCIESFYIGDEVIDARKMSHKDLMDYIESLGIPTFERLRDFVNKSPRMRHVVSYTNDLGTEVKIEMSTLNDFFGLL